MARELADMIDAISQHDVGLLHTVRVNWIYEISNHFFLPLLLAFSTIGLIPMYSQAFSIDLETIVIFFGGGGRGVGEV